MSSLKERGPVKRGFTGLLSVLPAFGGMLDWPAGLGGAAWRRGLPCSLLLPIRVSGPGRVKDRDRPGAVGDGAARGRVRLRELVAAVTRAASSCRVGPGGTGGRQPVA